MKSNKTVNDIARTLLKQRSEPSDRPIAGAVMERVLEFVTHEELPMATLPYFFSGKTAGITSAMVDLLGDRLDPTGSYFIDPHEYLARQMLRLLKGRKDNS